MYTPEPTDISDLGCTTAFPGGNGIVSFRMSTDGEPTIVELTAECKGAALPLWFSVDITGLSGECIQLRLANALQMNGDHRAWAGNTLVYRDGPNPWKRTGLPIIEDDGTGVPRVVYPLKTEYNHLQIASCFPYQREDLRQTIRQAIGWEPARIGRSAQGRVIERYRLGSHTSAASHDSRKRRSVYVLCGQTSGESSTHWLLDGLMRAAVHPGDKNSPSLNELIDLWVVPVADIDSAEAGKYGRCQSAGDFEAAWTTPAKRTEVQALMLDLERWSLATKPALVINLQGTSHEDRESYAIAHTDHRAGRAVCSQFVQDVHALTAISLRPADNRHQQIGGLLPDFATTPGTWADWIATMFDCGTVTIAPSLQGSSHMDFGINEYRQLGQHLASAIGTALQN